MTWRVVRTRRVEPAVGPWTLGSCIASLLASIAILWVLPDFVRDWERRHAALFVVPTWLLTCGVAIAFLRATQRRRTSRNERDEAGDEEELPNYMRPLRVWLVTSTWIAGLTAIALPVLWADGPVSIPGGTGYLILFTFANTVIMMVTAGRQDRADRVWLARRADTANRTSGALLLSKPVLVRQSEKPVRVRRRPRGRASVHSAVEWLFLGFIVLGFPSLVWLLGPAPGMFAYVAIGFMLMALTNRLDTLASERFWTPGNERAAIRKRQAKHSGTTWMASAPPQSLKLMRIGFLTLVVVGFALCIVRPFLLDWDDRDRYMPAVIYVTGFLVGLILLGRAELVQVRREREWLDERREERERAGRA